MRKIIFVLLSLVACCTLKSQNPSNVADVEEIEIKQIPSRDHILIQFGHTIWLDKPDSLNDLTRGKFNRAFSFYGMYDFQLRKKSKFSFAIGAGMRFTNVYFNHTNLDILGYASGANQAVFTNLEGQEHFRKSKLTNFYLEAPLELRFSSNVYNFTRGVKVALGVKLGLLLNSYTKYVRLQTGSGQLISNHKEKYFSNRFFQSYNYNATFRIGWGITTLFAEYSLNTLFNQNQGPNVRPLTVGLTISGL